VKGFTTVVLGSATVVNVAFRVSGARWRAVAYHDVTDGETFRAQMQWLSQHSEPVTSADIAEAFDTGVRLPPRAVWITFDDGHAGVVERAQPVLDEFGIRATLFVCPGLVESGVPPWWEVIEVASRYELLPKVHDTERDVGDLIRYLKRVPDRRRRDIVDETWGSIVDAGLESVFSPPLSITQLRNWVAAGHSVGNHTWDHPCLDQCDAHEQAEQIVRADEWLRSALPDHPRVFAYPNGDWTRAAEEVLEDLEYRIAALFDHRLNTSLANRLRVSRLRVSSDAPLARFRAVASGSHSGVYNVVRRSAPAES
jgi:peptidoglycan/xylan/chitin deacetylase (PgdA/CDA1 family)